MDACTNPDILRVIWFGREIFDIIKIIIPIALIVLGIINFSKSVISSDEKVQKKSVNLFLKRILYAILIFIIPWLIEVLIITLGDLAVLDSNEVNFTDCIDNANGECIGALDSGINSDIKQNCDVSKDYGNSCYLCVEKEGVKTIIKYEWGYNLANNFIQNSNKKCYATSQNYESKDSCLAVNDSIEKCYYCPQTKEYIFGEKPQKKCGENNVWEIDYARNEESCNQSIDKTGYKCYICSVNDLYYWRDKKPNEVCMSANGWEIDYTIKEEAKCQYADENYFFDMLR